MRRSSPARLRREAQGLTTLEVALRARVTESTVLRAERSGCSLVLAERLATIYDCSVNLFLPQPTDKRKGAAGAYKKRGATTAKRDQAGTVIGR